MPSQSRLEPAAERRELILVAAEAEFTERGFSAGSTNRIVARAGISKGNLFQYFPAKRDLCTAVVLRAGLRIRGELEGPAASPDWATDFFGALGAFLRAWIRHFEAHPRDRALVSAVMLEPDLTALRTIRETAYPVYVGILRPRFEEARAGGQLRADADLEMFGGLIRLFLPSLALAHHLPGPSPLLGIAAGSDESADGLAERFLGVMKVAFQSQ